MATMQAYQIVGWGKAEYRELAVPEPGPGQILVKVAGAGLCATDVSILRSPAGFWPEPPYTIGHENAGRVAKIGANVADLEEGDAVLISAMYYCASCDRCARGQQESCRKIALPAYGIGYDGGLSEYMLVEARHAVPLGSLDPLKAAPLADAGVTSYHAVKLALPHLVPGSTAVVIGIGGLGSYALQYLRMLTGVRVIAISRSQRNLNNALRLGADEVVVSDENAAAAVQDLTSGGAEVVFDFVGTTPALAMGVEMLTQGGRMFELGIAGGEIPMGWEKLIFNSGFVNVRGYNRSHLNEVVALARADKLELEASHFGFGQIEEGIEALSNGEVRGRAVITFDD